MSTPHKTGKAIGQRGQDQILTFTNWNDISFHCRLHPQDPRSSPLEHLMKVLPGVESIHYLLLENVCGFEKSKSRDLVTETLSSAGFSLEEFLICPRQINIPNSRMRYYLLAKRFPNSSFPLKSELRKDFQLLSNSMKEMNICAETKTVKDYLEADVDEDDYLVPEKVLNKHATVLDIIRSDSCISCCFTSGYCRWST